MNQPSFPWSRFGLLLAVVFTIGVLSDYALTHPPTDADLWPMLRGFALLLGCTGYLGWSFVQEVRGRRRANPQEALSPGRALLILLLFIIGVPLSGATADLLRPALPSWLANALPWALICCAAFGVGAFASRPRRRATGRA